MTVPQANLLIYQGSLFTVTIPGGAASWGVRMQLRSAPVNQSGVLSLTLTTGGGGIVWNGTGFTATITPTQSNAMSLLGGVWDVYGDPDGVPDNATVILEFGTWAMRPFVTAESVVPQPPILSPNTGDVLEWNGTQWAPAQPPRSEIIFRPGGASLGNVVATWAEVQTFISAQNGACNVFVDDSIVSPAVVPGSSGVTTMGPSALMPYAKTFPSPVALKIQDGATLRNLSRVTGNLQIACESKTVESLSWDFTTANQIRLGEEASIVFDAGATMRAASVPTGKSLYLIGHLRTQVDGSAHLGFPLISVAGGGNVVLFIIGSVLSENVVGGAGNLAIYYDDEAEFWSEQLGTGSAQPFLLASMPNLTGSYSSTKASRDSYVIDFVADCGADPTGTRDSSAAWDTAYAILSALATDTLLPQRSTELVIPPGRYKCASALATPVWDFLNRTTTLTIRGTPDASIITVDAGFQGPIFANLYRCFIRDLTFVGVRGNLLGDCVICFGGAVNDIGAIERCNFFNIVATLAVVELTNGRWAVRDCDFVNTASLNAAKAVFWSSKCPALLFENTFFVDVGKVNGFAGISKSQANLGPWFRHDDSAAAPSGTIVQELCFKGCLFDESALGGIVVVGGPTRNVPYVRVEGCEFNPSSLGTANYPDISLTNVDLFEGTSIVDSGFNPTDSGPLVALFSVKAAHLRGITPNNGSTANSVAADASTGLLEISDSPLLLTSKIISSATRTIVTLGGIVADLYPAKSNLTAGALIKIANTGGAPGADVLGTTDDATICAGVALDTALANAPVRVARFGQPVPSLLSDGAGVLAIGDPLVPSGATAGRVKKSSGASASIGVALSAAPAVADAVIDAQMVR